MADDLVDFENITIEIMYFDQYYPINQVFSHDASHLKN